MKPIRGDSTLTRGKCLDRPHPAAYIRLKDTFFFITYENVLCFIHTNAICVNSGVELCPCLSVYFERDLFFSKSSLEYIELAIYSEPIKGTGKEGVMQEVLK